MDGTGSVFERNGGGGTGLCRGGHAESAELAGCEGGDGACIGGDADDGKVGRSVLARDKRGVESGMFRSGHRGIWVGVGAVGNCRIMTRAKDNRKL